MVLLLYGHLADHGVLVVCSPLCTGVAVKHTRWLSCTLPSFPVLGSHRTAPSFKLHLRYVQLDRRRI
jgi:hypothetical protein